MTSDRECFVYVVLPGQTDFVTAGRFRWEETRAGRVGSFVYGRRYRDRPDAVELDPVELRLSGRVYETARMEGFFGAIRDAMPDYWGRCVIERNAGFAQLAEFDYLLAGPDDRAGALGFGLGADPPAPRRCFNRTLDLQRLLAAADALMADKPELAGSAGRQVEELLQLGTSMGGARPKAVVQDGNELWMAKFGRPTDRWNHPRVEHAMLELARACGLTAAESRIERVGGQDVLLVRRFDRDWAGDGYRRHRMVSAMTLLRAEESPTSRENWSYPILADEVRRTSADPASDLRELFGRMCFNAAISNLDDHPRNHAILAQQREWRLSPAYDLTPSPVAAVERRDLAMVCGRAGRYANRGNLLSEAGRFLLDADQAAAVFDGIVRTVRDQWLPILQRSGVNPGDCGAIRSALTYEGLFLEPAR